MCAAKFLMIANLGIPYQGVSPLWDIGPFKEVAMRFEPSVHYQLNSSEADEEWAALFPNGGIVRPGGNSSQPYMVSVFHQLRCLDILRRTYANADEPDALTAHCLHYLRQMVLCRRSLRMEAVVAIDNPHSVMLWNHMRCLDWRQVYKAAQED